MLGPQIEPRLARLLADMPDQTQPPARHSTAKAQLWIAFAAVYLVWGSTYLAIKYAVQTIPPYLMGGSRFLVAGAILYIWARMRGSENPTRKQWRDAAVVGALLPVRWKRSRRVGRAARSIRNHRAARGIRSALDGRDRLAATARKASTARRRNRVGSWDWLVSRCLPSRVRRT